MKRLGFALALCLLLVGCASKVILLPKQAVTPPGVDLSGDWVLVGTEGSSQPQARDTLVNMFVETGKVVKVTQTVDGLFVSYNRSIVEEYRFGEQREIRIGEITADRVSGWEGRAYVIETLDKNRARLIERWERRNEDELERSIMIVSGGVSLLSLTQNFVHVDSRK